MLHENQIYSVGSSGRVHVSPKRTDELLLICAALKRAVGKDTSWKLWQYRIGSTPHVALDIEGTAGLVSWTIIVNGNLRLSTEDQICRGREPVSEVYDSVDAFYFVEDLLKPFRSTSSSIRQFCGAECDNEVA
jgi:hypothetical protein